MITKFKLFEKYNAFKGKMLCINNHIGELTDKYNLTIGKKYNIFVEVTSSFNSYYLFDDVNNILFFDKSELKKIFSNAKSMEEYEIEKI